MDRIPRWKKFLSVDKQLEISTFRAGKDRADDRLSNWIQNTRGKVKDSDRPTVNVIGQDKGSTHRILPTKERQVPTTVVTQPFKKQTRQLLDVGHTKLTRPELTTDRQSGLSIILEPDLAFKKSFLSCRSSAVVKAVGDDLLDRHRHRHASRARLNQSKKTHDASPSNIRCHFDAGESHEKLISVDGNECTTSRFRFQRGIRKLLTIVKLFGQMKSTSSVLGEARAFLRSKDGQLLSFNVNDYKISSQGTGLSVAAKRALKKEANRRTDKDISMLEGIVSRLPCLSRYSTDIRKALARKLNYAHYEKGRVIYRKGHVGHNLFFLISGTVNMWDTWADPFTGRSTTSITEEVTPGRAFGEVALLTDARRSLTAVCKENCECLCLDKSDFNNVLRKLHQEYYTYRRNVINSLPLFEKWDEREFNHCVNTSHLEEYEDKNVVYNYRTDPFPNIHYISKGRAGVIREIDLVHRRPTQHQRSSIHLPEEDLSRLTPHGKTWNDNAKSIKRKEKHLVSVGNLDSGEYFGIGENLRNTYILSDGKLECIVMNRKHFNTETKQKEINSIQKSKDEIRPSDKFLCQQLRKSRDWKSYKERVLEEIKKEKERKRSTAQGGASRGQMGSWGWGGEGKP